ncbi:hypothetical protein CC78DRAFT_611330 [Lojkania enalia]|uniref:Uncharacterized protein n=1 Tax=Lojkania enalia TaxID=147567 RepID=A0A9P4TRJ6_9PLEO|nr:hypothetical protein CC78DRAFT_611330 [Didymosphaeria enalia]
MVCKFEQTSSQEPGYYWNTGYAAALEELEKFRIRLSTELEYIWQNFARKEHNFYQSSEGERSKNRAQLQSMETGSKQSWLPTLFDDLGLPVGRQQYSPQLTSDATC